MAFDEEKFRGAIVGDLKPLTGKVALFEYDPEWPVLFSHEADRIRLALGERALRIEHTGSTSVPGLIAKPIIDILLVVSNSASEDSYVPFLEAFGYVLRVREPDWHEHRMFRGPDTETHLHVFSEGCSEIDRLLSFRDWLRAHPEDRELYASAKLKLSLQDWKYMQNYADAKTEVIEAIIARSRSHS